MAQNPLEGFLLVDKPSGPTSHDVIDMVRDATGVRKVGHAGTLDPFATGLLVIAVGKATKSIQDFVGLDKSYEATLRFGAVSDTMDRTGIVTKTDRPCDFDDDRLEEVLTSFRGSQKQTPPMFSAKKLKGRKLYELAREGKTVEREPREITVHELELLSHEGEVATLRTRVSSGTYIRVLADDIGEKLECGAYLEELRRTTVGPFRVEDAIPAEDLTLERVREGLFRPE